ncbi:MFS transporter [Spirochaetota bacterium]
MNQSDKKKVFTTLFISIFVTLIGVGVVVPLLPVYAHDLGASGLYIGFIFGAFSLSRAICLPFFGKISDKKGRKPFILVGLFSYSLVSIAFVFTKSIESLVFVRFLQGIASAMIIPVAQAYVGEITPKGKESLNMGIFNIALLSGMSIGPLLGGLIKDNFSLQAAFGCMGILSITALLLCIIFLPKLKDEMTTSIKNGPAISIIKLIRDKGIFRLLIFRFAYTSSIGIMWSFLPVFADTKLALSSSQIGILIMLGVSTSGALQIPMGYIADRINKNIMVVAGGLITGMSILSLVFAQNFWHLFFSNLFFGVGGGISLPPLLGLATQRGNENKAMGSVMSLLTMSHSIGLVFGSTIAGLTVDFFEIQYIFPSGALVMLVGIIFFLVLTSTSKKLKSFL